LSYTKERFLFHFTSWVLVAGKIPLLHYGILLTNILSLLAISYYAYKLVLFFKLPKLAAVAMILSPGIWQPIRFSTIDLLWVALMTASIYYFESKSKYKLAIALTLGMLARNLTLGFIIAFALVDLLDRKNIIVKKNYLLSLLIPIAIYYGPFKHWQDMHWPASSKLFNGESYLTLPFVTFANQVKDFFLAQNWLSLAMSVFGFVFFLGLILSTILITLRKNKIYYEAIVICGFTSLIFALTNVAWSNSLVQISRVLMPCFICYIILIHKTYPKYLNFVLSFIIIISCYTYSWFIFSQKQILVSGVLK
jgi:hypothetical protein